jgi:hypothetical protein
MRSKTGSCVYENPPQPSQLQAPGVQLSTPLTRDSSTNRESRVPPSYGSSSQVATSSTSASTPASYPSALDAVSVTSKIRPLADQLSMGAERSIASPIPISNFNITTTTSRLGGTFHFHRDIRRFGQPQEISHSVTHKARLFGQSHWINGISLVSSYRPPRLIG